jgi:arginyl-tRNA synthetase
MLKEIKKVINDVLVEMDIEDELTYSVELSPISVDADVSSNIMLLLSKKLKKNPKEISEVMLSKIQKNQIISDVKFQAGFINIKLSDDFLYKKLKSILFSGHITDKDNVLKNKRILIEFVSANPTGPLHIGHGRGAAYGDSLSRLFEFLGANVEREYYINDVGNQMEVLTNSVLSYLNNTAFPEN